MMVMEGEEEWTHKIVEKRKGQGRSLPTVYFAADAPVVNSPRNDGDEGGGDAKKAKTSGMATTMKTNTAVTRKSVKTGNTITITTVTTTTTVITVTRVTSELVRGVMRAGKKVGRRVLSFFS